MTQDADPPAMYEIRLPNWSMQMRKPERPAKRERLATRERV